MFKETYHPNAFLSNIRNIKLGLLARTRILNILDKDSANARTIARETEMFYGAIMHHLRLLEAEGIVQRKGSKPYAWLLTGSGQKRLVNTG
jgi:predicted transcriptional regulator